MWNTGTQSTLLGVAIAQSQIMNISSRSFAILGAVGVVFIWSHWIIISRIGVHSKLSPIDISLLRFGTATILTAPFWLRYDWSKVNIWKSILVALGTGFPYTLLSFYGLQSAKAAKAGVLINGLLPVFGAILAILWIKSKLQAQQILGISIVILANALMLWGSGFNISQTTQFWGVLFLILASVCYSFYMASVKAWGFNFNDVIAQVPLINTLFLIPIALIFPSHLSEARWQDILLQSSYQGLVVTIGAGILVTNAIQKLGAVTTSLFIAFVPAVTAILAFMYLGEALTIIEAISIGLCTIGIFVYTKSGNSLSR